MTRCPFSPFKAWSYALKNLYLSLTAHSSTSQHDPWLWTWVGSVHCLFYQETLYSVTEPVSLFFVTLKLSWNQAAVVLSHLWCSNASQWLLFMHSGRDAGLENRLENYGWQSNFDLCSVCASGHFQNGLIVGLLQD